MTDPLPAPPSAPEGPDRQWFKVTASCEVCRNHSHAKWHDVARGHINPVALIGFVESLPKSAATTAIVGYITAVTGLDYRKMQDMLKAEGEGR